MDVDSIVNHTVSAVQWGHRQSREGTPFSSRPKVVIDAMQSQTAAALVEPPRPITAGLRYQSSSTPSQVEYETTSADPSLTGYLFHRICILEEPVAELVRPHMPTILCIADVPAHGDPDRVDVMRRVVR